jgi:hypothetical protein
VRLSLSLPHGPGLSAPTCAPSLPLSLAAPWARFVGVVPFTRVLALSLSRRPHLSARPQPSAHDPRRGHAHDRTISGHLRTSSPLLSPAPRLPTFPRSLAPSTEPSRPLSHSPRATRELCHRPLSIVVRSATVVEPAPVCCLGEFRLAVSYLGHPLVCPSPLWFARSALTGAFLAQPEPHRR